MTGEITRQLIAARRGDRQAFDALLPLVYESLRRLAGNRLRGERPDHSLSPTDLVHEAYLKLVRLDRVEWQDRAHFYALAARAMRRILVDHARRRTMQKRGGDLVRVTLDEHARPYEVRIERLIALDRALERLERDSERRARVVECRFFVGMSVDETAAALDISPASVKREWAAARAWLNRELATGREADADQEEA